jgi:hypothetical protein
VLSPHPLPLVRPVHHLDDAVAVAQLRELLTFVCTMGDATPRLTLEEIAMSLRELLDHPRTGRLHASSRTARLGPG